MNSHRHTHVGGLRPEHLEPRMVLSAALGLPSTEHLIVVLNDEVSDSRVAAESVSDRHGGQLRHVYQQALRGFSGKFPAQAAESLAKHPWVDYVQPVNVFRASAQTLPTGVDRIGIDEQFPEVTGPEDLSFANQVNVAVIDTGIDFDHPDLNVVGGENFVATATSFYDDHGHGTHVSGTIGALDNNQGVVGVAPGANLYGLKVLDDTGYGTTDDVIAAIDWITATRNDDQPANDIHVANMSLTDTGQDMALRTAIQNSVAAGVVFVAAAGNDSQDIYGPDGTFETSDDVIPAAYPEVMTVSGLTDHDGIPGGTGGTFWDRILYGADDRFASYSNYSTTVVAENPVASPGAAIDLILPGTNIYSTDIDGYSTKTGTSMASPHGAGLAALYVAQNGPATTATEVYALRQALIDGAKAQDSADGLANGGDPDSNPEPVGWPVVGPVDAAPSVSIINPEDGSTVSGNVMVSAVATDDIGVNQVEFFVDGESIGMDEDGTDGWSWEWDTSADSEGSHVITSTATDTAGQIANDQVSVFVDNDASPIVSITNPGDGTTVSGSVMVTAEATDDNGVNQVEFFVDGESIGVDEDGTDGWSWEWDTSAYSEGSHVIIMATATDTAGQTDSHTVDVTVDNPAPTQTIHVGDLEAEKNIKGRSGKWEAFFTVLVLDAVGNPVSDALVEGTWTSGDAGNTVSGSTGIGGSVTVGTGNITASAATFTVSMITASGFTYDASANAETTITINYSDSLLSASNLIAPKFIEPVEPWSPTIEQLKRDSSVLSNEESLVWLEPTSGTRFPPEVVDELLEAIEETPAVPELAELTKVLARDLFLLVELGG